MRSRPLMTLRLSAAPTQRLGTGPRGTRLTFPDDGAKGAPYLRTLPRFETADARYSFLNRLLAVGRERSAPTDPFT